MKQLAIKQYSVMGPDGPQTTQGMIKHCLSQAPPQGFNIQEVRDRLRIEDAMKGAQENIGLEDADAKNLQNIVRQAAWGVYHADIVDFVEAVENMK